MAEMKQGARNAPASVAPKKDSSAVTPDSVRAKLSIPQDMQDGYQRIVLAAKKIMYSEQLKPQMMALLKEPGTTGEKIGKGVVALMAILYSQSNNTLPPQLIIPAATELVAEAADFLRKAGMKVSDDDVAEGMATMVEEILSRAGVEPEQIPELIAQQGGAQPQMGA
jgi:hypothetical protein